MTTKILLLLVTSLSAIAQQNYINVPSADVTKKNRLFFQQQLNFNELVQSNTTLDYGIGRGFEIGVNVLGLNFNDKTGSFLNNDSADSDPYNPLVLINALKRIELTKHTSIAIGSQAGINFIDNKKQSRAGLTYLNLRLTDLMLKNSSFVIGTYYNSLNYGGSGNRFGFWVASEVPLTSKFHLMSESVIGNNALSYSSIGIVYYPFEWMPLTLGAQIPNTKSNAYSVVFELTIIPTSN